MNMRSLNLASQCPRMNGRPLRITAVESSDYQPSAPAEAAKFRAFFESRGLPFGITRFNYGKGAAR